MALTNRQSAIDLTIKGHVSDGETWTQLNIETHLDLKESTLKETLDVMREIYNDAVRRIDVDVHQEGKR